MVFLVEIERIVIPIEECFIGFVQFAEIVVVGKSKFSGCAIVQIMGTRICVDNKLLKNIRVERYE